MWDFLREISATRHDHHPRVRRTIWKSAETLCRNIAIINGGRIIARERMSSLLRRLHLARPSCSTCAMPTCAGAGARGLRTATHRRSATLEVEISKDDNLNDIFARLSALGIEVLSMRNKANRLEEIFMRLVERRGGTSEAGATRATTPPRSPCARRPEWRDEKRRPRRARGQSQRGALDRLQDHRHPRVRPHPAHLGTDHRALGGDLGIVFSPSSAASSAGASGRWTA